MPGQYRRKLGDGGCDHSGWAEGPDPPAAIASRDAAAGWTVWIEGEWGGDYDDLEVALAEGVACTLNRAAVAIVAREGDGDELHVQVESVPQGHERA